MSTSTLYDKLHYINTCYNNANSFIFNVLYIENFQNLISTEKGLCQFQNKQWHFSYFPCYILERINIIYTVCLLPESLGKYNVIFNLFCPLSISRERLVFLESICIFRKYGPEKGTYKITHFRIRNYLIIRQPHSDSKKSNRSVSFFFYQKSASFRKGYQSVDV